MKGWWSPLRPCTGTHRRSWISQNLSSEGCAEVKTFDSYFCSIIEYCFHHRVLTLVAVKLKDSGYKRFTSVLQNNCIRQLERQLPWLCKPVIPLHSDVLSAGSWGCNTNLTATLKCAFVMTFSQIFWGFSVYCGCQDVHASGQLPFWLP